MIGFWSGRAPGGGGGSGDHGSLTGLSDDDHSQYYNASRIASWLALRTEVELAGVPLDVSTTYNIDGSLATITKGAETKTFTYDSGKVDTITNGTWTKTFAYNIDGSLDTVTIS